LLSAIHTPTTGIIPDVELLIIRHGLPVRIDDGDDPADPGLSEEGHDQAGRLADWLRHDKVTALYTSPMRRAQQTAAPLGEALGLEPVVDDEIAEFDRGQHFYIPVEEMKAAGDPRYDALMRGEPMTEVDPYTFREVVAVAIERIIEANRGGTVAVVCHGGVINAWASHVLGITQPLFFQPHYTSVNRFLASSAGHRGVASLNELGHLHGTRA
jgi:probable phosphoglycerate mutase